jgi:putative nucleotidyltransferase with HDIG domain
MKKNIARLNKTNIVSGRLFDLVPELYELKDVIENSADGWHDQESVFDHTLSVMNALEKAFLNFHGYIKGTINKEVTTNTRKILLKVATVLHDIGKKETIVKDQNGFTICEGHEKISVQKAKKILNLFDVSREEAEFILNIIENHHIFHRLLRTDNQNFQQEFVTLKNKFSGTIWTELILLSYADTINSQLKRVDAKEFRRRINFYKQEIEKL